MPSLLNAEEDDVQVSLLSVSVQDLFKYKEDDRTIMFDDQKSRNKIIRGLLCPEPNVQVTFKLQSKTHGVSIQSIVIPVVKNQKTSSKSKEALSLLKVSKPKIFANGRLTLTFNSPVKWPILQTDSAATETKSLRRALKDNIGYHISELVSASVLDNGDDDDTGNKRIASIGLLDYYPTHIEL